MSSFFMDPLSESIAIEQAADNLQTINEQFLFVYNNPVNSNEDLSDQVVLMFKALAKALKVIWNNTTAFLKSVFGSIGRMRYYIKQIEDKLDSNTLNTHQWQSLLVLDNEISVYSVDDKLPKYSVDLIRRLDETLQFVDFYLNEYATLGAGVLKNMVYELENFNEDDPKLSLNELNYEASLLVAKNTPPAFKLTPADSRYTKDYWKVCNLPTDKSLFVSRVKLVENTDPLGRAESILQNVLSFNETRALHKVSIDRKGDIVSPTPDEVRRLCAMMTTMCDRIESYEKLYDEMTASKEKLLDATELLVRRLSVGGISSADVPFYKTAVRYNSFITATLIQTCTTVSSLAMKLNRATLVICNKAIVNVK